MKEKTKVYIYTRVSTAVQVDGYSLDAQKSRMKAYAEFNDFEIVGEYEDAGKSGKSIEGRLEFNRMMEDIKSGKDGVSYVLVFKLSRFGRNAADVLSTLQVMQDFDVNLICVEDGIDSSKDAGKLMISVLSAVAEIERENIRVQTMEGRIQKAREGKWNGGFAPYGYKLEKGMLYINEEEAEAIRIIFDQYVHTDIGANGLAKYLANHGINKIQRQNGKNPLFDAALIRRILKNPVYCGKIAYGRRRTEKVHGTRNDYRLVEQENYLLVDGLHEAIVSEGLWHEAQVKLLAQAKKYEKVNNGKDNKVHLLTGLLKCPICGAGMYGNKSIKHKPDGTKYKDFFYYGCKHRTMTRGHKCEYKKQINEELLDGAVAEVIIKLVSNPKFAAMMQQKINMKIDTSAIEQEIANYEKQLRQSYATKSRLIDEIDTLDPDDKHYIKRKADLDDRLYKMYDKIEDTENLLIEARAKKMAIEAEKLTADNIYKVLIYFEKLYAVMDEQEKRQIMESLISEIHIYEERQPNGQWLKSIKFKLPIIEEDMEMSLDSDTHVETLFTDKEYLEQAVQYLNQTDSNPVQELQTVSGLDIRLTPEMERRLRALIPEEAMPQGETLRLSDDKAFCMEQMRTSMQKNMDEAAWPSSQYLWKLHPIFSWVNDKAGLLFKRAEAPVLGLPGVLYPGEALYIVSGSVPNLKSTPLIDEWFGLLYRDGQFIQRLSMEEVVQKAGLRSARIPNTNCITNQSIVAASSLLHDVVTQAKTYLTERYQQYQAEMNPKLDAEVDKLIELQEKHKEYYQTTLFEHERQLQEQERRVDKLFDDFTNWVKETLTIQNNPYIRIVSVLMGVSE